MNKEEFEKRHAELVKLLDQLKEDVDYIVKVIPEIEKTLSSATYETVTECDEKLEEIFDELESKLKVIEMLFF